MLSTQRLLLAALASLFFGCASGQALEITGAYGNAPGCALNKGGVADSEELLLVTAGEIRSYGTGCEIVQLLQSKNGNEAVAVGLCGYEGEGYPGVEHYVIRKTEANASLQVYQSNGELWAEVAPCP